MAAPAPAPSAAAPATIVVDARFCAPEGTAFAVTKTISVTGRDFTVTDATGAAVMQVEAEVFAFLRRPVLTMRDAGLFMGTQWDVFRGDSTSRRNKLFSAVRSLAFQIIRTRIYVYLDENAGEQAPDFVIRGSYYDGACTVCTGNSDAAIAQASGICQTPKPCYDTPRAIRFDLGSSIYRRFFPPMAMRITRQNTVGGALLGRNTYTARINPGIDRAFILALTVILEEMHHNR